MYDLKEEFDIAESKLYWYLDLKVFDNLWLPITNLHEKCEKFVKGRKIINFKFYTNLLTDKKKVKLKYFINLVGKKIRCTKWNGKSIYNDINKNYNIDILNVTQFLDNCRGKYSSLNG